MFGASSKLRASRGLSSWRGALWVVYKAQGVKETGRIVSSLLKNILENAREYGMVSCFQFISVKLYAFPHIPILINLQHFHNQSNPQVLEGSRLYRQFFLEDEYSKFYQTGAKGHSDDPNDSDCQNACPLKRRFWIPKRRTKLLMPHPWFLLFPVPAVSVPKNSASGSAKTKTLSARVSCSVWPPCPLKDLVGGKE